MKTVRKRFAISLMVSAILICTLLFFSGDNVRIVWAASGPYYNDIRDVCIYQYNTTSSTWVLQYNVTSSGGSYRVHDSWKTKFIVDVKVNSSLVSGVTQARDYTRCNITIATAIWNNLPMNNTGTPYLEGSFYIASKVGNWTNSGYPVAGTTYTVTIVYQAYY